VIKLKKDEARSLPVLMIDSTDHVTPKTGLVAGDTTIQVSKNGGAFDAFDDTGKWTERGQGLYFIDFGVGDLDTEGYFAYLVTAAGADQFSGMAYVDDFADYKANIASLNDPTAAAIADAVWDEVLTAAQHNVATSAGRRVRQLEDATLIREDTCQVSTLSTVVLDAGASAVDGFYDHCIVVLTSGTGAYQARCMDDYVGATKVGTVHPDWKVAPDATSKYTLYTFVEVHVHQIQGTALAEINAEISTVLDTDIPADPTEGSINDRINNLPDDPASEAALDMFIIAAVGNIDADILAAHAITDGKIDAVQSDMDDVADDVPVIKQVLTGKWEITGNQLIMYDDDGTTPLYTFDLANAAGAAASTRIFKRTPA